MTDQTHKRTSSRPPPSIAPPTDEIDSEWGSAPDAAALKPAPLPSIEKPAAQPLATARKQTLLGLAPPDLTKNASKSAPPISGSATATPLANLLKPASVAPAAAKPASVAPAAAKPASVAPASGNTKGTLLGLAPPVIPASATPHAPEAAEKLASQPPGSQAAAAALKLAKAELKPAATKDASAKTDVASTRSDTPITADVPAARAKSTEAPPSSTAATQSSKAPERTGRSSTPLLALLAVAAIVIAYFAARRNAPEALPEAAADHPVGVQSVINPAPPPPEPAAAPAPSITAAAEPAAAPSAPAAEPSAPAAATATAVAAPTPSAAPSAAAGEAREIHVVTDPPGAKLFYKGRDMGATPLTLQLPAGETRSYEVVLRGYITRRLVVDGSKSDIGVGLRPLPVAAPAPAAPAGDAPAPAPPAEAPAN